MPTGDEIAEAAAAVAWWDSRSAGEQLFWSAITGSSDPRLTWAALKRSCGGAAVEPMRAALVYLYHESVYLLRPLNDAARDWLRQMAPEEAEWWGDSLAMEPRYIDAIVRAFEQAGGDVVG